MKEITYPKKRTYKKDNIITISKDIPEHLIAYGLGVLDGMGVPYKIDPESPLYRTMRGFQTDRLRDIIAGRKSRDKTPFESGYRVFHLGGDEGDTSVTVKPAYDV